MFRVIVLLVAIIAVSAFAPMSRVSRSNALKMGFETEIGAQAPLGM